MEWLAVQSGEAVSFLVDLAIKSTLLLAVAWLLSNVFRRTSAANRHLIWLCALASLILLPVLSHYFSDWQISFRPPVSENRTAAGGAVPLNFSGTETGIFSRDGEFFDQPTVEREANFFSATLESSLSRLRLTQWSYWLIATWGIGMAIILASLVLGALKVRHFENEAHLVSSGAWIDLLRELGRNLGLRKPVTLLQMDKATMPMTWGVRKPVVLVPGNFAEWTAEQQRLVLLHELAHVKRMDCLTQMFAWVVCALYWYNPLVWLALRRMHIERERACDDLVLSRGAKASTYAGHLLEVADAFRSFKSGSIAAIAMARQSQLEGRLLAVLDVNRNRSGATKWALLLVLTLMALLILPLAACRTPATPEKPNISPFARKAEFPTGNNPADLARGDLDGDGKSDLVVANYYENTLSVFRNISSVRDTINYAEPISISTGQTPITVNLRDVDGDGKTDLIVANHFGKSISIYRNTSIKGTLDETSFAPRVDLPTQAGPSGAIVGDLNRDGKPDLIVANNGHARGDGISIFENVGSLGEIAFAERIDIPTGVQPTFLAARDLDGDGRPDIAVANHSSYTLTLLRNLKASGSLSTASFAPGMDIRTNQRHGDQPYRVAISDLDVDGKADLIVGSRKNTTLYRNTSVPGTFAFAPKVDIATGSDGAVGLAVGDLNSDGKPDLAIGHLNTNIVSVFFNVGTRGRISADSFAPKVDLRANQGSSGVVITDLNGDGKADLAVANEKASTISVFRNVAQRR